MPGGDTEDPGFQILAWDSEKFGVRVARVDGRTESSELIQVARRMKDDGVELAYYTTPESRPPIDDSVATMVDVKLVDTRVTFARPTSVVGTSATGVPRGHRDVNEFEIRSRSASDADADLVDLALQAGEHSRFRTDPRIDARIFRSIYTAWLTRSVRREIADEVFVATRAKRAVGLLTLSATAGRGTIGLLSVDRSARGRGLGRRLADLSVEWSAARGCGFTQVVTQLANHAACRLYQNAGYEIAARERTYHLWLRFAPGA